jgi:hypothetical protein
MRLEQKMSWCWDQISRGIMMVITMMFQQETVARSRHFQQAESTRTITTATSEITLYLRNRGDSPLRLWSRTEAVKLPRVNGSSVLNWDSVRTSISRPAFLHRPRFFTNWFDSIEWSSCARQRASSTIFRYLWLTIPTRQLVIRPRIYTVQGR